MSDSYRYIDPEHIYTDPKTGVLNNVLGISDPDDLLFVESSAVTKRLEELYKTPILIQGTASLFEIHNHLFKDIYSWAGKARTVEISKDGKQFFPTEFFQNGFKYIDDLISQYKKTPKQEKEQIAERLAEILDNVNYLHPFREGNGRTQRELLRVLALEKGYELNLNPPDRPNVFKRYMEGTINGDTKMMTDLIKELMQETGR